MGFDISVQIIFFMELFKAEDDLLETLCCIFQSKYFVRIFGLYILKISAFTVFKQNIIVIVILLEPMHSHYILIVHLFHTYYFPLQILKHILVISRHLFLVDHLQGELLSTWITHQIDIAKCAPPEHTYTLVFIKKNRLRGNWPIHLNFIVARYT